jgi:hypothetical protein
VNQDPQLSAHDGVSPGGAAGAVATTGGGQLPLDEEPDQHVPGSFLQSLPQFFVFPLILVVTLTAAYLGLRLLVGFDSSSVPELLADIRSAPGPHGRWQSMHSLADGLRRERLKLDDVPVSELTALYAAYAGDSPQMRQFLLQVLQWKRAPELTAIALGALEDGDPDVRLSALYALAQMEDPAAVPALVARLLSDSREERFVALGALARIGTPEARDAIAGLLAGSDPELWRNAVLALAGAGDVRAAPHLAGLLRRESYAGDASLEGPDAGRQDETSRAAARADVEEQFLVNAARAAGRLRDPALVPLLEQLRANDPSVKVRSAAIGALHDLHALPAGQSGDPPTNP